MKQITKNGKSSLVFFDYRVGVVKDAVGNLAVSIKGFSGWYRIPVSELVDFKKSCLVLIGHLHEGSPCSMHSIAKILREDDNLLVPIIFSYEGGKSAVHISLLDDSNVYWLGHTSFPLFVEAVMISSAKIQELLDSKDLSGMDKVKMIDVPCPF